MFFQKRSDALHLYNTIRRIIDGLVCTCIIHIAATYYNNNIMGFVLHMEPAGDTKIYSTHVQDLHDIVHDIVCLSVCKHHQNICKEVNEGSWGVGDNQEWI
jgi:hypothetical protein